MLICPKSSGHKVEKHHPEGKPSPQKKDINTIGFEDRLHLHSMLWKIHRKNQQACPGDRISSITVLVHEHATESESHKQQNEQITTLLVLIAEYYNNCLNKN